SSSTPGPNAPLGNLCSNSSLPNYSAEAAFSQWTGAGFPASKMLLGLPLYGYVSNSTATVLTGSFVDPVPTTEEGKGGRIPRVDTRGLGLPHVNKEVDSGWRRNDAGIRKEDCGNGSSSTPKDSNGSASTPSSTTVLVRAPTPLRPTLPHQLLPPQMLRQIFKAGSAQEIPFSSIVASGALVGLAGGTFGGGGGFTEGWDNCSDTPATFAKTSGMAGCFTWSLDQDDGVVLQNVIRASLGLS
ncbi:hypothetical protein BT96DRAFT_952072, partial [Gymnopus androsaceus JB14]